MNRKRVYLIILSLVLTVLSGCSCGHDWLDATCASPKTCRKCSLTEGDPLSHNWQDATCEHPRLCSLCGAEEGKMIEHDFTFSNGYMRCTMCEVTDSEAEILPPLSFPTDDMTDEERMSFIDLNGQNNLRNNARFQYHDDVLYGQYWDEEGQSLFISMDFTSGMVMLLDYGWPKNVYIADGNIYYENIQPETSDHGIYRINMNDGEYVSQDKISDAYGSMQRKDNSIYYSDFSTQFVSVSGDEDKTGLYRCDLNGGNVEKILDKHVQEFYVFDTGILYQDREDGDSLHICYPDGTGDQKLNNQVSSSPIYDGEYIYYLSTSNAKGKQTKNYTIWRMKTDGTENQQISRYPVINMFALHEDYIYFGNGNTHSKLFRMKKDGSEDSIVTTDSYIYLVQFVNGKLKYTKYDSKLETIEGNYFCDPDGKNSWKFDPFA